MLLTGSSDYGGKMTPQLLFEYIVNAMAGIAVGIFVMWLIWSFFTD